MYNILLIRLDSCVLTDLAFIVNQRRPFATAKTD